MNSFKCILQTIFLSGLLVGAAHGVESAVGAAEDSKVRTLWMQGYVKIEEAEQADRAGNRQSARELFRQAHAILVEVHKNHPEWNPSLLQFRIAYCEDQVRRLEQSPDSDFANMTRENLIFMLRENAEKIRDLLKDNQQAKSEMAALKPALEEARTAATRNAGSADQTADLLRENRRLLTRVEVQRERIDRLTAEVNTLRQSSGIQEAQDRLRAELDVAVARRKQMENLLENMRDDYDRLEARLRDAATEQQGKKLQSEMLQAELGRRQTAITELETKIVSLEARLREATLEVPDLKEEIMRLQDSIQDHKEVTDMLTGELVSLREIRDRYNAAVEKRTELERRLASENEVDTVADDTAEIPAMPVLPRARQIDGSIIEQTGRKLVEEHAKRVGGQDKLTMRRHVLNLYWDIVKLRFELDFRDRLLEREQAVTHNLKSRVDELTSENASLNATLSGIDERMETSGQIRELLPQKERQIGLLQEKTRQVEARLAERTSELRQFETAADSLSRDNSELKAMVANLQASNRDLEARNAELVKADQLRSDESGMMAGIRQLQTRNEALEKELLAMKSRVDDQVRLLRLQERHLARLAQEKKTLETEVEHQARNLQEDPASRATDLDTLVPTGQAGRTDSGASGSTLDEFTEQLKQAMSDREAARQRAEELEDRLAAREKSLAQLRQLLERERGGDDAAVNNALLAQLLNKTRELELQRQRYQAVRNALDQAGQSDLPEIQGIVLTEEQRQRQNDREQFVRNLLREGLAAEKAGDPEAAVWNYKKILEYDVRNKLALQRLGHLAVQAGRDEEAERYLQRAFYIDPDDGDTLIPLGFVYARRERLDLAVSSLTRATALAPENSQVHRQLGIICVNLGWPEAAENEFRKALDLDGSDGMSAFNLAVLLAADEPPRLEEARQWYHKARDLGTDGDAQLDAFFQYPQGE